MHLFYKSCDDFALTFNLASPACNESGYGSGTHLEEQQRHLAVLQV